MRGDEHGSGERAAASILPDADSPTERIPAFARIQIVLIEPIRVGAGKKYNGALRADVTLLSTFPVSLFFVSVTAITQKPARRSRSGSALRCRQRRTPIDTAVLQLGGANSACL